MFKNPHLKSVISNYCSCDGRLVLVMDYFHGRALNTIMKLQKEVEKRGMERVDSSSPPPPTSTHLTPKPSEDYD